jgi:Sulfotransferase family
VSKPDHGHRGPIFVVGAMGSGTTLLRLILDSHDSIAIAQETGFVRAVLANEYIPFWKWGGVWGQRLGWSEDEFRQEVAGFYDHLFRRLADQHGKQRWGDKTPFHVWHMATLLRYFPDAQIVGTVRHPGANAKSLQGRFNWSWQKSVMHWVRWNMQMLHSAAELGDRVAICRYEDLVLGLEPVMRGMLDWLGEPWSDKVLEHHKVHVERGTPTEVEGRTRSTDPLDPTRISRWTAAMTDHDWPLLRDRAADLAGFFGYDVNDAQHVTDLNGVGGYPRMLTGEAVRERMADHPGVDWSFRPAASLANGLLTPRALQREMKRVAVAAKPRRPPAPAPAPGLARRVARRLPPRFRARLRRIVSGARTVTR